MVGSGRQQWTSVLLSLCLLVSCQRNDQPVAQTALAPLVKAKSFLPRMQQAIALGDEHFILISYDDFTALKDRVPASPKQRGRAAEISALTTQPHALGVFGTLQDGPFKSDFFLVARNLRRSGKSPTQYEASEFALVSMTASGSGKHIKDPQLAFAGEIRTKECGVRRGCHPIFATSDGSAQAHRYASPDEGGAGLPESVINNAETPADGVNAEGMLPELWLIQDPDIGGEPNRFVCQGEVVSPGACSDEPATGGLGIAGAEVQWALDPSVRVISEADYRELVGRRSVFALEQEQIAKVILPAATVANAPETMGLIAQVAEAAWVNGVVIVARDLTIGKLGEVEASAFYLPTVGVSGPVRLAAENIRFGMSGRRTLTMNGPCGPVSVPSTGVCELPVCLPRATPIEPGNPLYGTARWPALPRATVRVLALHRPMLDEHIYACAEFRPPPVQSPCGGNPSWWLGTETCNGVDDDCDGDVDEGGVCNACKR